jgi:hypothetical protein
MSRNLESVLDGARQLPLEDKRQLAAQLLEDVTRAEATDSDIEANLAIVRETRGVIKGLDRATIIQLAEDEEFCGY